MLITLLAILCISPGFPQTLRITAEPGNDGAAVVRDIRSGESFRVNKDKSELKSFMLQYSALTSGHKLMIEVAGTAAAAGASNEYAFADRMSSKPFDFQADVVNKQITVKENDGTNTTTLATFRFLKPAATDATAASTTRNRDSTGGGRLEPLEDYLSRMIADYEYTPLGWIRVQTTGLTAKEKRAQNNTTHLFFDEYGNSLLGTMPQGVSNRQYIVHVIYKGFSDKQRSATFSVKQKTGSFSSALNINNSGILKQLPNGLQGNEEEGEFDQWKDELFPLGIATDDVAFDIVETTTTDGKPVKVVLETQTLKMSPVFHASMDIGLINSKLNNPTFTLVDAPDGSGNKVVKQADRSPKGIVTVMATFYTSPIVLIEKLFEKSMKKRIPDYKLTGRSFFDDHALFERIYPTLGVSVSSKSFENLFFGLNWELARGLSVFGGGHWGKVNTFEMPGFMPGSTTVTQAQFDYYTNTKWKVDWAYGVKLDISIVTNLFK
jgi:hypothetical protein